MKVISIIIFFAALNIYLISAQDEHPYQVKIGDITLLKQNDKSLINQQTLNSKHFFGSLERLTYETQIFTNDYIFSGKNLLEINMKCIANNELPDNSYMQIKIDGMELVEHPAISSFTITSGNYLSKKISYDFGLPGERHNLVIKLIDDKGKVNSELNKNILTVTGATSKKMVLMEMACGILCGPCLAHIEEAHKFTQLHKDSIAFVIYNKAPVGVGEYGDYTKPYNNFHKTFNIGYQSSVMMDRTFDADNLNSQEGNDTEVISDIELAYHKQINAEYVPVDVTVTSDYNSETREVELNLKANFTDYAEGDMRFYTVLTQDTVIGPIGQSTTKSYAQGTMSSYDDVYGYHGEMLFGSWYAIPNYPHTNACKYQPKGYFGNAGIIPSKVHPGDTFEEKITFTLPEFGNTDLDYDVVPINPKGIEVIASVVKYGELKERPVLNSTKTPLIKNNTAIHENKRAEAAHFRILNQVSDGRFIIDVSAVSSQESILRILDIYGNECKSFNIIL
ncbi:MAG: hypothetical protein QG635_69, partial [Bacteroidota bacterium]|nr:hypothetical protein [Bacteroidota bacterium]